MCSSSQPVTSLHGRGIRSL